MNWSMTAFTATLEQHSFMYFCCHATNPVKRFSRLDLVGSAGNAAAGSSKATAALQVGNSIVVCRSYGQSVVFFLPGNVLIDKLDRQVNVFFFINKHVGGNHTGDNNTIEITEVQVTPAASCITFRNKKIKNKRAN